VAQSKAHIKASQKYNQKAYDEIKLFVYKGRKPEIQAHAQQQGESTNKFINRAVEETIERDNAANGATNPAANGVVVSTEGGAGQGTPNTPAAVDAVHARETHEKPDRKKSARAADPLIHALDALADELGVQERVT
jgi:hypothetical protein